TTAPWHCTIHTLSLPDALPIFRMDTGVPQLSQYPLPDRDEPEQPIHQFLAPGGLSITNPLVAWQFQNIVWAPAQPCPLPELFRRSEEHTSELQSRENLVCRLLL